MCISYLMQAVMIFVLLEKGNSQYQLMRVLGGVPTTIQQYPILAQLLLDTWGTQQFSQDCAGVILTAKHVLSAAHCFHIHRNTGRNYTTAKYWKIRVGSSYRSRGGSLYKVKSIIPHEAFDGDYYTNDVAVVVVARRFVFGNFVRQGTIIKPGKEIASDSICTLPGWGVTEKGKPQPEQLQHTTMYTVDQEECSIRYRTIGAIIADSMLCAGRIDVGGVDGCYGDSGGPLIYKGVVVGLVSFGYDCGFKYYPGVYTKVSHFTDWIIKKIGANK